jgi:hypothetical protein
VDDCHTQRIFQHCDLTGSDLRGGAIGLFPVIACFYKGPLMLGLDCQLATGRCPRVCLNSTIGFGVLIAALCCAGAFIFPVSAQEARWDPRVMLRQTNGEAANRRLRFIRGILPTLCG